MADLSGIGEDFVFTELQESIQFSIQSFMYIGLLRIACNSA